MGLPVAALQILITLADADRHGYAIMQDVADRTDGAVRLGPGTLYGTIKRLLQDGLIQELDARSHPADDERRRYYRITARGRRAAAAPASPSDAPIAAIVRLSLNTRRSTAARLAPIAMRTASSTLRSATRKETTP